MNKLNKYKFADLYEMSSGISTKPAQAGHGSPFISFSTVFNNYILPEELEDLMDTSVEEQDKYSIKEGDILLTRTSETKNELGMSSVAIKDYPNVTYSGFLKRLRPIQRDKTYAKYMAFYLRGYLFRKSMKNNSTLTLRASLNEAIFSYLDLLLPSYNQQKKIGNFLYSIHQKIALNHQINTQLEALAKLIYDYWFVQFDFPNADGQPYKSSGGKMVFSEELGREVPEGWEVGELSDIANITMGQSPSGDSYNETGEGTVFYQGSTDFGWRFPSIRKYTTSPKRFAKENDILLSVRAPVGTLNIAKENCCIGRGLAALSSKIGSNNYLFSVLQDFKLVFEQRNSMGTTFGSINKNDLHSLSIVIPPDDVLNSFDKITSNFDETIFVKSKENHHLTQLRDWLLPLLMNGQVRVE